MATMIEAQEGGFWGSIFGIDRKRQDETILRNILDKKLIKLCKGRGSYNFTSLELALGEIEKHYKGEELDRVTSESYLAFRKGDSISRVVCADRKSLKGSSVALVVSGSDSKKLCRFGFCVDDNKSVSIIGGHNGAIMPLEYEDENGAKLQVRLDGDRGLFGQALQQSIRRFLDQNQDTSEFFTPQEN